MEYLQRPPGLLQRTTVSGIDVNSLKLTKQWQQQWHRFQRDYRIEW